ncbi:hypothetical protein PANDA_001366 [Ailuropoda melanoleuca]|uniref:Uncharacterized protein n=1 Tax=Ailuropoda melanoleuca TaxID=9646 RepID=D2GWZ0_AILME|nr:hypothetical protein PANDA_001366 [Ailuropoda melanoleuca]
MGLESRMNCVTTFEEVCRLTPYCFVRIFTYLIGREAAFADNLKWMACANKGFFTQISTLADVQENVMEYLHVLSRPKVIDQEHDVVWTEAYIDSTLADDQGLVLMTTVAMPVFSKQNETRSKGILLGVVGTDVPVKELLKTIPKYKASPAPGDFSAVCQLESAPSGAGGPHRSIRLKQMDGTGPGLMAEGWQVSTKVTGGCHHLGVHEDDINWSLCPLAAQGCGEWKRELFGILEHKVDGQSTWAPGFGHGALEVSAIGSDVLKLTLNICGLETGEKGVDGWLTRWSKPTALQRRVPPLAVLIRETGLGEIKAALADDLTEMFFSSSLSSSRCQYEEGKKRRKPNYSSVDLSEVEWEDRDDVLRNAMVNRKTGKFSMEVKKTVDKGKRVLVMTNDYYYTDIKGTPFSLGVALSRGHGKYFFRGNVTIEEGLHDLEHPDVSLADEWSYCNTDLHPEHRHLSQLEAIKLYLKGKEPLLQCDKELIQEVLFDAVVSAPIEAYWTSLALNKSENSDKGVEVAFLGTRTGLSRINLFVGAEQLTNQDFLKAGDKENIFNADHFPLWYRRAAEQIPGSFVYSIPFSTGIVNKSNVVTASTSIQLLDERKSPVVAGDRISLPIAITQCAFVPEL